MSAYQEILDKAKSDKKHYRKALKKVEKRWRLQEQQLAHQTAFESIDCLKCARCCKGYSPRFSTSDIKRISKVMHLKEGAFINQYLKLDEEDDFVLQKQPCPFLGSDNACGIYEWRPKDCRRYPYTDEDVFVKKQALSMKNLVICPAVSKVLDYMTESL
jgi:Fe-S-cluster containining protein